MKDFVISLCLSIVLGIILAAVYTYLPEMTYDTLQDPQETLVGTIIVGTFFICMLTMGTLPHVAGYAILASCGHVATMYATNGNDVVGKIIIAAVCYLLASLALGRTLDTPQATEEPPA